MRLGALGRAFSRRSDEARTSHEAHKLTLAVLGLQDALAQVGYRFDDLLVRWASFPNLYL